MKKLASLWSFVFLTLAATQLLSNCAQTNPPSTASAGGQTPVTPSQNTQPIVANHANGTAGYANGQTAMAATTDAPQGPAGQQDASASPFAGADYRISQQDILQISVFQVNDLNSALQVSQDGNITLALIGRVQVAGKTTS